MGNPQSGLSRCLKSYSENDAIMDPSQTSNVKIYYSNNNPDFVLIHKSIDFANLGLPADFLPGIIKRSEALPIDCLPGHPDYSNATPGSINVGFLTGTMNLNDFVMLRRIEGQAHMAEPTVRYLLDYLIDFGHKLQILGEYHYLLNMSNIFATTQGLKLQNPFIYKSYIGDSQKIVDQYDWLNQPTITDEIKAKQLMENRLYCEKIKQNVRQVGLVVLFSALHKHDTNLTDEQNNLDKDLINSALADFRTLFSKPLSTKVEAMIKLNSDIAALPFFSQVREGAPGQNSLFKVSPVECQKNFASKIHGPGGFFYRNYDLPPKEVQLDLSLLRQQFKPTQSFVGHDISNLEMSMRAERPNYTRRSVSPVLDLPHPKDSQAPSVNQPQYPSNNSPGLQSPPQNSPAQGLLIPPGSPQQYEPNPQIPRPPNQNPPVQNPTNQIPPIQPPQKQQEPQKAGHDDIDPIDALQIKEHDAIYGKIEQVFRERRPQSNEKSAKPGVNDTTKKNQSMIDTSNLHNHHYTGRFEKDPTTFKFPVMDTRYREQGNDFNLPPFQPQRPPADQPKPFVNPDFQQGKIPEPFSDSKSGAQTLYTMGRTGPKPVGPSAFIPPLDKLDKYRNSNYNPFQGSLLYMTNERKQYIATKKQQPLIDRYHNQNFHQNSLNSQPGYPGYPSPQPSIPQPPIVSPPKPADINFFTPNTNQGFFNYSPSDKSKKPLSPQQPNNQFSNQLSPNTSPYVPWPNFQNQNQTTNIYVNPSVKNDVARTNQQLPIIGDKGIIRTEEFITNKDPYQSRHDLEGGLPYGRRPALNDSTVVNGLPLVFKVT